MRKDQPLFQQCLSYTDDVWDNGISVRYTIVYDRKFLSRTKYPRCHHWQRNHIACRYSQVEVEGGVIDRDMSVSDREVIVIDRTEISVIIDRVTKEEQRCGDVRGRNKHDRGDSVIRGGGFVPPIILLTAPWSRPRSPSPRPDLADDLACFTSYTPPSSYWIACTENRSLQSGISFLFPLSLHFSFAYLQKYPYQKNSHICPILSRIIIIPSSRLH